MKRIDGAMFRAMLGSGYVALQRNVKEVNELNVFPVPDGDTGTNMGSTMEGGLKAVSEITSGIGDTSIAFARGSLYSAKGNSGVILSQFFAGLSEGLAHLESADVNEFAEAMQKAVKKAYQAVIKPVEGTILTVMREGSEAAKEKGADSFEEYFTVLVKKMKETLDETPELLKVLKDAGVIDSGGAGLLYIVQGMAQAIGGKLIQDVSLEIKHTPSPMLSDSSLFNEESKLDYGYCTEFILQLLNEKDGPKKFSLEKLISYYETLGDSLVAFQNGTIVKVHVHTKTPAKVIEYAQQFGEFVTFKMDNMTLQHEETLVERSKKIAQKVMPKETKKAAAVVALPNESAIEAFKSYHDAIFINGGDSINPSANDFLCAFKKASADKIIVIPNNKNAVLAAAQAIELSGQKNVAILENSTLGEGYAAFSILDFADLSFEDNLSRMKEAIKNAVSVSFSKASRQAKVDDIEIDEGETFAIEKGKVILKEKDVVSCLKSLLDKFDNLEEKSLATLFVGASLSKKEIEEIKDFIQGKIPYIEIVSFDIGRQLYELELVLE